MEDHNDIINGFADAVEAVPMDEPLMEGLVKRAKTSGLERIVAYRDDNKLHRLALAELCRRNAA